MLLRQLNNPKATNYYNIKHKKQGEVELHMQSVGCKRQVQLYTCTFVYTHVHLHEHNVYSVQDTKNNVTYSSVTSVKFFISSIVSVSKLLLTRFLTKEHIHMYL